jgi:DNA polymerase-3 subunit gamma/tau
MRDSLSLLDQAIVYGSGNVNLLAVTGMLGSVAQQPVDDILQALAAGDAREVLAKISTVAELTPDFSDILRQILQILHRVAITQQLPDFVDHEFDKASIANLAQALSLEDVQLFYQIGLVGQKDLELAPDPRCGFEMVMLRMLAFRPQQSVKSPEPEPKAVAAPPRAVVAYHQAPPVATIAENRPVSPPATETVSWTKIVSALQIGGRSRELAHNCVLDSLEDNFCRLSLDPSFQRIGNRAEDNLQEALQNYYGRPIKLVITQQQAQLMTPAVEMSRAREDKQQAAVDEINTDMTVQALKESFGARVLPGSIEPLNQTPENT